MSENHKKCNDELSMMISSIVGARQTRVLQNSWANQESPERQMRLRAVMLLSAELERVKEQTLAATRLGEGAIEAIIMGEWDLARDYTKWLSFEGEHEDYRLKIQPIWDRFVTTLRVACDEHARNKDATEVPKPH